MHRLERGEEVHDNKFNFVCAVLAKDISALIAFDLFQRGQYFVFEKTLIRVRVLYLGPTSPMTCNHDLPRLGLNVF